MKPLDPPHTIEGDPNATEMLRLWAAHRRLNVVINVSAEDEALVIRPVRKARAGWAAAFRKMAQRGDDALLEETPSLSDWDECEWEWR